MKIKLSMASIQNLVDKPPNAAADTSGHVDSFPKRTASIGIVPQSTMNMKSGFDSALEKGQTVITTSGPKGDELLKKHGANGRFTCDCEACRSHIKAQHALQGKEKLNPVDKLID